MKVRRRLLLSFLTTIVLVRALPPPQDNAAGNAAHQKALQASPATAAGAQATANAKDKADAAPKQTIADGADGKPHRGPWVGVGAASTSDGGGGDGDNKGRKSDAAKGGGNGREGGSKGKTKGEAGGLKEQKPAPRPLNEPPIPQSNDGVMDDRLRAAPEKGKTGTEGGVSEKDRSRKAHEGRTGERPEARPEAPKEAPPLPHSEEQKIRADQGAKDGGAAAAAAAAAAADASAAAAATSSDDSGRKGKDSNAAEDEGLVKGLGGLAKPADLPPKPHDMPHPVPASSKIDHLSTADTLAKSATETAAAAASGLLQPLHSLFLSLTMILFSEIGDKTFLIAALMAMKHPRLLVFSAAFAALIAMTVLSAVLGHAVPSLIPKRYTNLLAAVLFLVFGAKMAREGQQMDPHETASEEMKEVELELEEREHHTYHNHHHSHHHHYSHKQFSHSKGGGGGSHASASLVSPYALEAGQLPPAGGTRKARSNSRLPARARSPSLSPTSSRSPSPSARRGGGVGGALSPVRSALVGLNNLLSLLLSPAWVQTFVMTFLGEWGDRSQIATIAMAAGQDYWWVTAGAVTGHALCTAAAVLGGRAIAGRVSVRVVTLSGAVVFFIFGVIYLVEALYYYTPSVSASSTL